MTEEEWLDKFSSPLTEAQRDGVLDVIARQAQSSSRRSVARFPSRVVPVQQSPLQEAA